MLANRCINRSNNSCGARQVEFLFTRWTLFFSLALRVASTWLGWQLFIIFSDTCLSKLCRVATSVASVQQPAMRPLADLLVNSTAPTQLQHTQTQGNSNFQMIYETLHIISECVYHFFSLWKNLGTGDVDKWQKTALRPFMLPLSLTSLLSLGLVPGWEQAALNFIQHAHPASVLGNEEKRGEDGRGTGHRSPCH